MAPSSVCASLALLSALATASALDISIDTSNVQHQLNPLYMGCHSDSGFVHQVRGWSSQMVFGESFEAPQPQDTPGQSSYAWQPQVSADIATRVNITLDSTRPFAGQSSQHIRIADGDGAGSAGLANRGLGNEGLYLEAGKPYEGYFFAASDSDVTFEVRLETTNGTKVLASQTVAHHAAVAAGANTNSGGFVQHNFTLTPSEGTECVGITPGSDPSVHCTNNPGTAHVCIRCGGQFTVALKASAGAGAEAFVDYVVLQPGEWGRFKGLNARKDVADTMARMGVKAIRLGGSFCSVTSDDGRYYQWENWTGPVWQRPSVGAHWDSYNGKSYNLIGGWGPFEMIDYAVALGAEPIITTTMSSTAEQFADLVEYCWGNATTTLGRKRASDGHPEPYRLRYVELGNEQYNHDYVSQVAAMEQRANEVGAGGQLHYVFPSNGGVAGDDISATAKLGLGSRLVTDLHVGAGGALPVAEDLFAAHAAGGLTDDAAVNFETNAATHHHGRALQEAADLNDFFAAGNARVLARTASFCHGRAGHYDMFDQAISFFLPNMTWLQPPGHVHAMITDTWQPGALNATVASPSEPPSWSQIKDKALTCSGSEYRGDLGQMTAEQCLVASQKKASVNYAVWRGDSNQNCYVCSIAGRGDPSTWQLNDDVGAVSFVGKNVLQPVSVSAQRSEDGKTVVARIVNQGAEQDATLHLGGGWVAARAAAVSMASDDLNADNTAADVDRVAPRANDECAASGATVRVNLPGFSYTTVTMTA